MSKKYLCECGKEFDNPQSFNGHKCHCLKHREANGTLEYWKKVKEENTIKSSETFKKNYQTKKNENLQKWIAEQHQCETCKKVMTKKYASGRFCSRECANSRIMTSETKEKIRQSLIDKNQKVTNIKKKKRVHYCDACGSPIYGETNKRFCSLNCLKAYYTDQIFEELKNLKESGKIGDDLLFIPDNLNFLENKTEMQNLIEKLDDDGKLKRKYNNKCYNAKKEDLTCTLTFEEYCLLVDAAGLKSSDLGFSSEKKYVLARFNDKGNYFLGNCRFITQKENCDERKPTLEGKIAARSKYYKEDN